MKIGYVTASFPFGSAESFFDSEIHSLARLVNAVSVIPLYPRGGLRGDWEAPENVDVLGEGLLSTNIIIAFCIHIVRNPLEIVSALGHVIFNSGSIKKIIKNLAVLPKAAWLARKVVDWEIDHLHVQWAGTTATMVMLASRISRCKWSMTCHRWDIYEDNMLAIKSASASFTRFISEKGRSDSLRYGVSRDRTVVINMGVEITDSPPVLSIKRDVPVILCAANLLEVKGHVYLIEAIKLLRDAGIDVRLLLAGDGPMRSRLEGEVEKLGLDDRIDFLGNVPHSILMGKLQANAVDIFVLPSVDLGNGNHEGVPVSLMEAMSFGVPVISTKTGSIEELLSPSLNLTVPDKNSVAIYEKLSELILDHGRYSSISKAVGDLISNEWSSKRSAAKLIDMIGVNG